MKMIFSVRNDEFGEGVGKWYVHRSSTEVTVRYNMWQNCFLNKSGKWLPHFTGDGISDYCHSRREAIQVLRKVVKNLKKVPRPDRSLANAFDHFTTDV